MKKKIFGRNSESTVDRVMTIEKDVNYTIVGPNKCKKI